MIDRARSSHIGAGFSAAELLAVLYGKVLRISPLHPDWSGRDRFVLSKGHGAAALYAVLAERGFFVEIGHPEAGSLKYPGPGFLLDGANPMEGSRAAPALGEHNSEILGGQLGLTVEELGLLRAARVI